MTQYEMAQAVAKHMVDEMGVPQLIDFVIDALTQNLESMSPSDLEQLYNHHVVQKTVNSEYSPPVDTPSDSTGPSATLVPRKCSCSLNDLMAHGCKCGGK